MTNNNIQYIQRGGKSGRAKLTTMDPALIKTQPAADKATSFTPTWSFKDMPVQPLLKRNIQNQGYVSPTEIQYHAIPAIIGGVNVLGIAATGTGKTAAFLIPLIAQLLENKNGAGLVVVPTRELAQQVAQVFKSLSEGMQLSVACFIGGTSVATDIALAAKKHHLIIATPGRLLDLVNREAIRLSSIQVLILDEFDRMLDMGFISDIKTIVSLTRCRKQTILFSATIKTAQRTLIDQIVINPLTIHVSSGKTASSDIEQNIVEVGTNQNKIEVLYNLLNSDTFKKVILFAETKRTVDYINKQLTRKGLSSDIIHSSKSQNHRTKAIEQFKAGDTRILIATDVASRGLDVNDVTHVINYQLPQSMEAYIHRIGRTGRAGKKGVAYTFIN